MASIHCMICHDESYPLQRVCNCEGGFVHSECMEQFSKLNNGAWFMKCACSSTGNGVNVNGVEASILSPASVTRQRVPYLVTPTLVEFVQNQLQNALDSNPTAIESLESYSVDKAADLVKILFPSLAAQAAEKKEEESRINQLACERCHCFVNNDNVCPICKAEVCPECEAVIETSEHKCDEKAIETVKIIRNTCVKCPQCLVNVERTYGCDHMFCVKCYTSFDYRTGKRTKVYANPERTSLINLLTKEGKTEELRKITGQEAASIAEVNCDRIDGHSVYESTRTSVWWKIFAHDEFVTFIERLSTTRIRDLSVLASTNEMALISNQHDIMYGMCAAILRDGQNNVNDPEWMRKVLINDVIGPKFLGHVMSSAMRYYLVELHDAVLQIMLQFLTFSGDSIPHDVFNQMMEAFYVVWLRLKTRVDFLMSGDLTDAEKKHVESIVEIPRPSIITSMSKQTSKDAIFALPKGYSVTMMIMHMWMSGNGDYTRERIMTKSVEPDSKKYFDVPATFSTLRKACRRAKASFIQTIPSNSDIGALIVNPSGDESKEYASVQDVVTAMIMDEDIGDKDDDGLKLPPCVNVSGSGHTINVEAATALGMTLSEDGSLLSLGSATKASDVMSVVGGIIPTITITACSI